MPVSVSVTTRTLSRFVDRIIVEAGQMVKTCGQICDLCLGIRNARTEDAVAMVERPRISLAAPNSGSPMKLRELHFHS